MSTMHLLFYILFLKVILSEASPANIEPRKDAGDLISKKATHTLAPHKIPEKLSNGVDEKNNSALEQHKRGDPVHGRTWRISHKALVPILLGLGIKGLAILALTLSVLSLMGIAAILTSKLSLTINLLMFLRKFLSSEGGYGGFAILNPLNFPHAPLAHQDRYNGFGHRKSMQVNY